MNPSKKYVSLFLLSLFFSFIMKSDLYSKPESSLIRHVVCFKFKESASPREIKLVEESFNNLPALIAGIESIEWGINNSPEGLNKEFTHCFVVTFRNEEARKKYLPHPDHREFVSLLKPILEDVFVIDFTP